MEHSSKQRLGEFICPLTHLLLFAGRCVLIMMMALMMMFICLEMR